MPAAEELLKLYRELSEYVGFSADDVKLCIAAWGIVQTFVPELVDDFYTEVLKHPECQAVIKGGSQTVCRLKKTLRKWLEELFAGTYDLEFVQQRWLVGWRHVNIGLAQVWTAVSLSRLRDQLVRRLANSWQGPVEEFQRTASAITRLMDLDLAIIQNAYHTESVANYLRSEKGFNEAIIDTTQAIVMAIDDSGRIVRENVCLARLISDSVELPAHIDSIHQFISQEDVSQLEGLWSEPGDVGQVFGPWLTRVTSKHGQVHTIRWFGTNTSLMHDQPVTSRRKDVHLLVGHDITDLLDAQRRVVQQERLAAIGQTMAGLAHESRNAFQRSQAALETLTLELGDQTEALELVGRIQRANDHLLHLYEEVLQFAKPVRLELHRCCLRDIATTTCQHLVQAGICQSRQLDIQAPEDLPQVKVDPFAVEQVLRNLIENALVVSPKDTPVLVQLGFSSQRVSQVVQIEIVDAGPGIDAAHQERVFEPFFTTRSRGSGLGLPIARRLVEAHGGSLDLYSSPGGTRAVVTLPVVAKTESPFNPEDQPDHRRGE